MNPKQREYYISILTKNLCEIMLKNETVINCSLMDRYIPSPYNQLTLLYSKEYNKDHNNQSIMIFNTDTNNWIYIDVDNIASFKILTNTLATLTPEPQSRPAQSEYAQVMPDSEEMEVLPTMTITQKIPNIPARKRWMLRWLYKTKCIIRYKKENDGRIYELAATLEPWVTILVPQKHTQYTNNPDYLSVVDADDGYWVDIPYNNILLFKTPSEEYVPRKVANTTIHTHSINVADINEKVPESDLPTKPTLSQDFLIKLLQCSVYSVDFEKKDGTMRKMWCTLNPKYIVALNLVPKGNVVIQESKDRIKVVDVENKEWRTIIIDKIQKVEVSTPGNWKGYCLNPTNKVSRPISPTVKRRTKLTPVL